MRDEWKGARSSGGPKRDEAKHARILELTAKGLDTTQIAARLGCTAGTVAKVLRRSKEAAHG